LIVDASYLCRWIVDDEVIRVFHNKTRETGVAFPVSRPMAVQCSIWDGSEWATQGGRVRLNYSDAPFVAQYEGFGGVDGCQACLGIPSTACDDADLSSCSDAHKYWFLAQAELTQKQIQQLQKHSNKYLVYDYCTDAKRFPEGIPAECPYNTFHWGCNHSLDFICMTMPKNDSSINQQDHLLICCLCRIIMVACKVVFLKP
jgi:xyloglucan:xyloglucosyl transferase